MERQRLVRARRSARTRPLLLCALAVWASLGPTALPGAAVEVALAAKTPARPPAQAPAEAPDKTPPPVRDFERSVRAAMEKNRLVGISLALVRGTRLLYSAGFGAADLEKGRGMTAETPLLLASVSKTVTGAAAMQLVEAGKLSLDADINGYLPFRVRSPRAPGTPITVRMLMTHTSGIVDSGSFDEVAYSEGDSPLPLGTLVRDYLVPGRRFYGPDNFLPAGPGRGYEYSNIGVALLGYVIEMVSGEPFDAYCERHIFAPLKMASAGWKMAGLDPARVGLPYEVRGKTTVSAGHYGFPDYPDGQLRASAEDMSVFLRAFMTGGTLDGVRILAAASVAEMSRVQFPKLEESQGLIWYSDTVGDRTVLAHDGKETGVSTTIAFRPEDKVGVVLLCNTTSAQEGLQTRQDEALVALEAELFDLAAAFR